MIVAVRNSGEPIRLPHVNLIGISAGAAAKGQEVPVWTVLGVTSDEPVFHSAVPDFCAELSRLATEAGSPVGLERANSILLRVRLDRSGELWVDSVATSVGAMVKRPIGGGQPVFAADIADVVDVKFPAVDFESGDGIVYLFRQCWRFGLYYDLRLDGSLEVAKMGRAIGALYRNLAYRHLYDAVGDATSMVALIAAGWFPFVEIAGEFAGLVTAHRSGVAVKESEAAVTDAFDDARIDRLRDRWLAHPVLGTRPLVLGSALEAFRRSDHVSTVKIVLTEIEGILNDAHRRAHGSGAKLPKLLKFVATAGELKAGGPDTLLFPQSFRDFLLGSTFAQSDARAPSGRAGSRHAVGHGAAGEDAYTRVRALQAILTMDQLVFFL
jgi:hypothetical protein